MKKIEDIKEKKISFNYKPVLVGGLHKLQNITAPAFIKPKLKHMINDCELIAKKNKFNFIWNSKFPINSLNIISKNLGTLPDIVLDPTFLIDNHLFDVFYSVLSPLHWVCAFCV